MSSLLIAALVLVMLGIGYQMGVSRSLAVADGGRLHSRPGYHGALVAAWAVIPVLLVLAIWALSSGTLTRSYITSMLPAEVVEAGGGTLVGAIQRVRAIASGVGVAGEVQDWERVAGESLARFQFYSKLIAVVAAATLGVLGLVAARKRIAPRLRARNQVERLIGGLLIFCSTVAILTTIGIVASLIVETLRFFSFVSPVDFFFGTVWNPRFATTGAGAGSYGLLPLLWGTIMVTAIALLTAVPIGLMTAIYLSQYATPRVRNTVKPIVEILSGIPTIVYGFFALVTVGPWLSSAGAAIGLNVNATSALTAGLVMGVMIIPFISSLSDDVIRQVPSAMRDGALGLGATKSETIRNVIIPAALPGIVGAVLLAVSRAIGETMIVVLAAGNAPILRADPTQPISTITVTIVNQLTGDSDFASPQSLVAFALGLTLFIITLCLNVGALYIVRRYREQYE